MFKQLILSAIVVSSIVTEDAFSSCIPTYTELSKVEKQDYGDDNAGCDIICVIVPPLGLALTTGMAVSSVSDALAASKDRELGVYGAGVLTEARAGDGIRIRKLQKFLADEGKSVTASEITEVINFGDSNNIFCSAAGVYSEQDFRNWLYLAL